MIPIGDRNPTRHFPVVTVIVIVLNFLVFIYQQLLPAAELDQFIISAGMIPYRVTQDFSLGAAFSLITCMFMHGSWMHILGNMLYLWIFGDNIEDRLGSMRYAIYYLAMGVIASLAQIAMAPLSKVPTIGASGAVAGVLGTYLVFFPRTRVRTPRSHLSLFPSHRTACPGCAWLLVRAPVVQWRSIRRPGEYGRRGLVRSYWRLCSRTHRWLGARRAGPGTTAT